MTSSTDAPQGRRTRWFANPWVWAPAVVVLVVLAVAVPQLLGDDITGQDAPAPGVSAGPGATATSTPTPTPGASDAAGDGASPSTAPEDTVAPTEPGARPTASPVDLEGPASPSPSVEVALTSIEAVTGEATIPGEVGGPSLRITVEVTNGTDAAIDLTSAVTNLYYGDDLTPAISLLEPGSLALPSTVAPGQRASGVSVFLVPVEARGLVTVEFDLSTDATVVLFVGSVPV